MLRTGEACRALGARIERRRQRALARRRPRRRRAARAARHARFRQCRHRLAADDGRGRRPCRSSPTFDGDASLRKRPMRRMLDPLLLMGAQVLAQAEGGRCPIVAASGTRASRRRSSTARPSPRRRSNRRCCWPGLNAPGRTTVIETRGLARPHREDARAFRRRGRSRALEGAGPADHADGPPRTAATAGRRAGRSVFGRLPDRRRAGRAGLRHRRSRA